MPLAVTQAEFAADMAALAPFEPAPRLAAGVSGGPDSMALAMLARDWAAARDGSLLAIIVDHGLRANSGEEADWTLARLAERGIETEIIRLRGLQRGPALAERARHARFAALADACARRGIVHLLLAHHAADQAETVLMRVLGGSANRGVAGIAPLVESGSLRVLRPLLATPPIRLRATLSAVGMPWVNDPSNADTRALRPRLRHLRGDRDGTGPATAALVKAAEAARERRAQEDAATADWLATHVSLYPEGYALLPDAPMPAPAFSALVQTIAGAAYPPPSRSVIALAAAPRAATISGIRLLQAGRLGRGWLMVREAAAIAGPVPAHRSTIWDGRYRFGPTADIPPGATIGALGADAPRLRHLRALPAAILATLPAIRWRDTLVAVPHLGYFSGAAGSAVPIVFSPPVPAAGAPYPAYADECANGDA